MYFLTNFCVWIISVLIVINQASVGITVATDRVIVCENQCSGAVGEQMRPAKVLPGSNSPLNPHHLHDNLLIPPFNYFVVEKPRRYIKYPISQTAFPVFAYPPFNQKSTSDRILSGVFFQFKPQSTHLPVSLENTILLI